MVNISTGIRYYEWENFQYSENMMLPSLKLYKDTTGFYILRVKSK